MAPMTRYLPAVFAVIVLSACEPSFVEVTFDGVPKCEGSKLSADVIVKLDGPRVSSFYRINGDGAPLTTKLVAGKIYKLKAYKCVSDPCETEKNFFHGADVTAPEGKTGRVTLSLPGVPECVSLAPPPAAVIEDAGAPVDAGI